ncbi:Tad domain-containing protein [Nocardioides piscis]|uniref:Putative Flp pilus-assembly TadG-like N-terminal domain-containing protein n=1 Tax=Nocardioides piscis TaxID=2714938 RepID=A0A6G7YJG2_9ACTN|nr:Tad domain-containing protein [Nocardioides piscis]QIK76875.1 hypothetical protein G7071_16990 [Nocardioides piscis]
MLSSTQARRQRTEEGAVAVLTVLLCLALFGIAAIVVDLGNAQMQRRIAQNAGDSAALAGGNAMFNSAAPYVPDLVNAETAAKDYALKNHGITAAEWSACVDPGALSTPSSTPCISFEVTPTIARVRVKIPTRDAGATFARIIGVNTLDVSAFARSTLNRDGKSLCGLCVVGTSMEHDMQNGKVTVNGADIHLNGDVEVGPNGLVATTGEIRVEGTADGSNYTPSPDEGALPIPDPLEDWFDKPDMTGLPLGTNPCAQGPGRYGDFNFPNSTCTLSPGLYVVTGKWDLAGLAGMVGNGVTLFFTCGTAPIPSACISPGEAGGWLNFAGNGVFNIVAPTTGDYAGMALWYDRLNNSPLDLNGNGSVTYTGTVYANSAELRFTGNACGTGALDALVIVRTVRLSGANPCLELNYNQAASTQLPPGRLHLDQ